jgi:hypothetical protein
LLDGGIEALRNDALRTGRRATATAEMESRILCVALHERGQSKWTHWSTRRLAEHLGMGAMTIHRACHSNVSAIPS